MNLVALQAQSLLSPVTLPSKVVGHNQATQDSECQLHTWFLRLAYLEYQIDITACHRSLLVSQCPSIAASLAG